jgi:hypothetical protein
MGARVAIILACGVGLGSAAVVGCEAAFTAGSGGGATTDSTSSASSSSGAAMPCSLADPGACGAGAYCLVSGADCSGSTGHCVAFPPMSLEEAPLCGCDGVTYWNGAVASDQHAPIWYAGPCGNAAHTCTAHSCMGSSRAKCDLNVPDTQCSSSATPMGVCWVLPQFCPQKGAGGHACTAGSPCATVCSLIEAEAPWATPATACTP